MTLELPRLKFHVSSWMQAALSSAQSRVLQKPPDKNGIPYQPALINCARNCEKYIFATECGLWLIQIKLQLYMFRNYYSISNCEKYIFATECGLWLIQIKLQLYMFRNYYSIRTCISLKRQWPTSFEAAVVMCRYNVATSIFSCRILRKMNTNSKMGLK